ncbi:hypothetical protein [uncultured Tateyamaria sp.]|uniref:hypothetical protein n=1 Tax=uncultured Tateyamaria sp. TaxID=455651 RepID=UPI0026376709|nr:hypothetical protein [uncultured Tateyamaria sp.]
MFRTFLARLSAGLHAFGASVGRLVVRGRQFVARQWFLFLFLPREKARLRRAWARDHRVAPTSAETHKATRTMLSAHAATMERMFWRSPRRRVKVSRPQDAVAAAEEALVGQVMEDWPAVEDALARATALDSMAARRLTLFARLRNDAPAPLLDADVLADRLLTARVARKTALQRAAGRAVAHTLAGLEAGFETWVQHLVAESLEPFEIQQLLVSPHTAPVAFHHVSESYLNADQHLEDQMFFDVDLVVTRDGALVFGVAPERAGGLLLKLRRWQRRSRKYEPKTEVFRAFAAAGRGGTVS